MLDCQTTGSSPAKGSVLEIAWSRGRAADGAWRADPGITSHLVRLPRGQSLPRKIAALTGVSGRVLARALPREQVRRRLVEQVRELAARSPGEAALGVAHFARFERAFLDDWGLRAAPADAARDGGSLELLCTHEIACRLLPGLPRRGLRAVAGHLGHVMDVRKRAAGHVRATVAVWCELAGRLGELGVATLSDLRRWFCEQEPARRGGREFSLPRERRLGLPDAPGVYRLQGRGGEVLYVGKATSLRRRVNSYFQHRHRRPGGDRTLEMLTQVWGVDVTPCASRLEAAVREADAIKEHAPPYNVALRAREPAAFFASPDLALVGPAADDGHRVGPLPRRDSLAALPALRRLLAGEKPATSDVWLAALGMGAPVPAENGRLDRRRLDPTGLREGFGLFRVRVGWTGRTEVTAPELLRVGGRLWREHLAEAREPDTDDDAPGSDDADERPRDPQDVARWFALALGRCAQLVRRAHWFERLCESSLWWRPRSGDAHLLRLERGRIVTAPAPGARAPVPRGATRPARERRRCFDAAVYDRLRVLTTELRRLVAEEAELELRLGPGPALDRAALARRLGGV